MNTTLLTKAISNTATLLTSPPQAMPKQTAEQVAAQLNSQLAVFNQSQSSNTDDESGS